MSRTLAVLVFSVILIGCRSSTNQGPVDPFLGATRVPPPSTGSVYTPPSDPYYSPQQHLPPQSGAPSSLGPHAILPGASARQPFDSSGPPHSAEGWSATPSFAGAALVAETATPDLRPRPDPRMGSAATVNREPIIRILEPPRQPVRAQSPSPSQPVPSRIVNIVDLPRAPGTTEASGFRTVSATQPRDSASPVVRAVAEQPVETFSPSPGYYGFDSSYASLRGRLEYSQVDQRWKLR